MQRKKLVIGNVKVFKNIKMIYILVIIVFLLTINNNFITNIASADPYSGPDYYVSVSSGSNSNDGSFSSPWKTIEYAVSQTGSGDTINIFAGEYTLTSQINIYDRNTIGSWYTIQNYNDDEVIIRAPNCPITNWIDAAFHFFDCRYIHLSGLCFDHSAKGALSFVRSNTCYPSHIVIDNCSFTGNAQHALKVAHCDNLIFEYNYLYDNFNDWSGLPHTPEDSALNQEVVSIESTVDFSINNNKFISNRFINIDIKGGGSRGDICYNKMDTSTPYYVKEYSGNLCWGEVAIYIDCSGVVDNIFIYNNNIWGNNTCINLDNENSFGHYEYIYIYNNILNVTNPTGGDINGFHSGRSPIKLSDLDSTSDVYHDIYIYSNTIHTGYGVSKNGAYGYCCIRQTGTLSPSKLDDVYIYNNIICSRDTQTIPLCIFEDFSFAQSSGIFHLANNCFYRSSGTINIRWGGTTYNSGSNPEKFGDDTIFANPSFMDWQEQNGDFHLKSNSPCIDSGYNTLVSSYDYNGVSKPQGSGYDIGAFEFSSSSNDNTLPQISYVSIATSNLLDTNVNFGWENISCTVTDDIAVDKVYIRIIRPNNNQINMEMTNIENSNYYYFNSSWLNYGNYSYIIRAIDTSGNNKYSNNFYFSLPPNWDINNDGRCSVLDLIMLSNCYNEIGPSGWIREDVDNNGKINLLDMSLVSNHYNEIWYT